MPVVRWLRHYEWRNLGSDLVAGATLGIYNIPQGMAYSVLASLPPVYGLYASFFPPLLYFLFGSSRHVSIGVFSITCLMVAHARTSIIPDGPDGAPNATSFHGIEDLTPVSVVMSLSFATGAIQLLMALLHLDFLTAYLSDPVIAGFNTGAACQAVLAQIPGLLGLQVAKVNSQLLMFFKQLVGIAEALHATNLAVMVISIISIAYLLFCKFVVEKKVRLKILPFPSELILMICSTVASSVFNFHERYNLKIVDHIPTGMPAPMLPRFELMPFQLRDAFSIAVVAFAVTVSMGKHFARQHKYTVDPNQELCALGAAGCISSFFSVFPTSTSLSRTIVNEGSGAKSQISGLISSLIILIVILWIGPLLSSLPMCVLSSIVVVALRSLLVKVTELPRLYRVSKIDFSVWIVTFVTTVCWDLIEGLLVGIVFAMFTVVLRSQWPLSHYVGLLDDGQYRDHARYKLSKEQRFPILRFDSPLIFTNVEHFKDAVRAAVARARPEIIVSPTSMSMSKVVDVSEVRLPTWSVLVVDCSTWTYTDAMGIDAIRELHAEMNLINVLIYFSGVKGSVREQFDSSGLLNELPDNIFYPTVTEAVKIAETIHHRQLVATANGDSKEV